MKRTLHTDDGQVRLEELLAREQEPALIAVGVPTGSFHLEVNPRTTKNLFPKLGKDNLERQTCLCTCVDFQLE